MFKLVPRRIVRLKCTKNNDTTSVFAKYPYKYNITLEDAEMAYYICSKVQDDDKKDECYLQFGVDRIKTEKYLEIVKQMNESYNQVNIKDAIIDNINNIKNAIIIFVTNIFYMFQLFYHIATLKK